MKVFERNFWVLVKPADDVPGQWVGHCLDLDIVSLGTTLQHAIEMTAEAVCMCIQDDLQNDCSPMDRTPAPPEFWTELSRVQRDGRYEDASNLPVDCPVIAAIQFHVRVERQQLSRWNDCVGQLPRVERPQFERRNDCFQQLPPAWLMAKYNSASHIGI
jgi:hypothetical protein